MSAQAKLLRVLQERDVQPVGSAKTRAVDVRVIAATNRDLIKMVSSGHFREDLYYRLSMVEIHLPQLFDRREDLPLLQKYFVDKFARQFGTHVKGITRRAQLKLARHTWPGNVRELENVIGSAVMMAQGHTIDLADLPDTLAHQIQSEEADRPLKSLEELANRHLLKVLEYVGGNKPRAAEILGVSRSTVYTMLDKIKNARLKKLLGRGA